MLQECPTAAVGGERGGVSRAIVMIDYYVDKSAAKLAISVCYVDTMAPCCYLGTLTRALFFRFRRGGENELRSRK